MEEERDEFYRQRNLKIYGYDDYTPPSLDTYIEPEVMKKPITIENIGEYNDDPLSQGIPTSYKPKTKQRFEKKGKKKEEKDPEEKAQSSNRLIFLLSSSISIATAIYLYSTMYRPYRIY